MSGCSQELELLRKLESRLRDLRLAFETRASVLVLMSAAAAVIREHDYFRQWQAKQATGRLPTPR